MAFIILKGKKRVVIDSNKGSNQVKKSKFIFIISKFIISNIIVK
jgi:hypothetical protein